MATAGAHMHTLPALAAHAAALWPLLAVAVTGGVTAAVARWRRVRTHFHD